MVNHEKTVQAQFVRKAEDEPQIAIDPEAETHGVRIQLSLGDGTELSAKTVEAGADVKAAANITGALRTILPLLRLLNWSINGRNINASIASPLSLSIESDTVISAVPIPPATRRTGENAVYGINHVTKHAIRLVYDPVGFPLKNRKVNFTQTRTPDDSVKIDHNLSSKETDSYGLAEIYISGGRKGIEPEKTFDVKCEVELDPGNKRSLTITGILLNEVFEIVNNENYRTFLRKNDTPKPITFRFLDESGPKAGKSIKLHIQVMNGIESVTLKNDLIITNSDGIGVIEFAPVKSEFGGRYAIYGMSGSLSEPLFIAGLDTFPETCKLSLMAFDKDTGGNPNLVSPGDRPMFIVGSTPQIISYFSDPSLFVDSLDFVIESTEGRYSNSQKDFIFGKNQENYPCLDFLSDIPNGTAITIISKHGYQSELRKVPEPD
ncbi:hypothetical protein [Burkholderia ambifaria]|uniref:Uncharacterized protein n=1 Tax=Burkholderia ambifaria MEX-5 TaxID=396597 RepID=B1TEZ6_9BURK|nr:hypothetical protein [Burkholderia ambifaria]EDT37861.1 hypothetical protein BamMEX5DRAFT_6362 [Burkholderia ambifaria MEX-5]